MRWSKARTTIAIGLAVLAAASLIPASAHARPDRADFIEAFARDVFVSVGLSLRNPTPETAADEPLYNVAGLNLGVTWGEWQAGAATSRMIEKGRGARARTDVRLSLSGLVPGGVYSIFYATIAPDSENPLCPGVERSLALPAVRPDANAPDASSFVAAADGTTDFHGAVDGHLLDATQVFFSVVYHADGMTYGALPNRGEFLTQGEDCRSSYGHDAMRQFLVLQKW